MKTLVVEDDFTSRLFLQEMLRSYGPCDVAVNGKEAVTAVKIALEARAQYDIICLDISMPEMDGQQALTEIRDLEKRIGRGPDFDAKILMTTARRDKDNILKSFREQCDGYLVKPLDKASLVGMLTQFGFAAPSKEKL